MRRHKEAPLKEGSLEIRSECKHQMDAIMSVQVLADHEPTRTLSLAIETIEHHAHQISRLNQFGFFSRFERFQF